MVTVQSLLWPGADDDRWWCGDEYLTENFSLCISFPPLPFLFYISISPNSLSPSPHLHLSVCLCPALPFLPQSPACPTSRLPQEPSSPQITQKATGTTWTASGSFSQIQAPESTWHSTTLTSRHPMIPWRWKMARQTMPSSLGGSLELRVPPIWHLTPTHWGWSFRLITPCQDEDLISHTVVCHSISLYSILSFKYRERTWFYLLCCKTGWGIGVLILQMTTSSLKHEFDAWLWLEK